MRVRKTSRLPAPHEPARERAVGSPDGCSLMRLPSKSRGCKGTTAFAIRRSWHEIPRCAKQPGKPCMRVSCGAKVWPMSRSVSFRSGTSTRANEPLLGEIYGAIAAHKGTKEKRLPYAPAPTAIESVPVPFALLAWRGYWREFTVAFNRAKAAEWSCETRDSSTFMRSAICFMVSSC